MDQAWAEAHEARAPYVCDGLTDTGLDGSEQLGAAEAACPGPNDYARHVFSLDAPSAVALDTNYYSATVHSCDVGAIPGFDFLDSEWPGARALYLARWQPGRYFVNRYQSGTLPSDELSFRALAVPFVGSSCDEPLVPLRLEG